VTGFPRWRGITGENLKGLITVVGFVLVFACQTFAGEQSALACITVYWHGEGSGEHASWNGARLREGHCAVDPKKIPYGSKVVFADAECVAVDSGPAVVNRKTARSCGRTVAERNAIVIDRFFDTKEKALAWARGHQHFMTVRILTPGAKQDILSAHHVML
jgi:3D (Asp-Asp-Asp) domain-containing protein